MFRASQDLDTHCNIFVGMLHHVPHYEALVNVKSLQIHIPDVSPSHIGRKLGRISSVIRADAASTLKPLLNPSWEASVVPLQ